MKPTTDAGRRLLDDYFSYAYGERRADAETRINAIAEEAVAAERERIRTAVQALEPQFDHHDIVKRHSVLAIVDLP